MTEEVVEQQEVPVEEPAQAVQNTTNQTNLIDPVDFVYEKPVEKKPIRMSDEAKMNLIKATMIEHISDAQITMPQLEKFTKSQINDAFHEMLENPPNIEMKNDIPYEVEFTPEEDVCLLNYIRNYKKTPLIDFIKSHSHIFKLCRSLQEIESRIKHIKTLKADDINDLIQAEIDQIVYEQMYYISLNEQTEEQKKQGIDPEMFKASRCFYQPNTSPKVRNQNVEKQINDIIAGLPFYTDTYFNKDSPLQNLAVLRTENNIYYMRRESILFGRQSIDCDVDVDISFESEPTCPHSSRHQAILTFRPDLNFYLENIGVRAFRVNGELLPSGEVCQLQEADILDFSGALFLFLPNNNLISQIRLAMSKAQV